eukprot:ctg_3872.g485
MGVCGGCGHGARGVETMGCAVGGHAHARP